MQLKTEVGIIGQPFLEQIPAHDWWTHVCFTKTRNMLLWETARTVTRTPPAVFSVYIYKS